jgi:hypothetical protein
MNYLARSNAGIEGSNSTQGIDVFMRVCVCGVLCICSGFATADPTSKEPYRLCIGLRK